MTRSRPGTARASLVVTLTMLLASWAAGMSRGPIVLALGARAYLLVDPAEDEDGGRGVGEGPTLETPGDRP